MRGTRERRKSFRPVGAIGVAGLGLSRARERELSLAHAWRSAAGPALAGQARVTVRRGVLEVEVTEPAWRAALEPLMPRIAARMARRCPELELRAWRAGGTTQAIRPTASAEPAAPRRRDGGRDAPTPPGDPLARLRRLAARCVRTRSAD